MRILLASSEVYPFSKTGGLGDVVGALPEALAKQGCEVLVVSPWYRTLKALPPPLWIGDVTIPFDGNYCQAGIGTLERGGVRYAFVGHSDFQRDDLYGYDDDLKRFCRFTRAIPQVAARLDFLPDIIHVNDWQTALLPLVLEHGWHLPEGFPGLPSILTVHNVQYQGGDLDEVLYWLRLPGALRESYLHHFGSANALQAGLGFATWVTTVSPTYAREIKTPEFGYQLDGTFRHISNKFSGILNGLDTNIWNPESDPHLPRRYSVNNPEGKRENKRTLCRHHHLDERLPLLAVISRLAEQKGVDILLEAVPGLLAQGWNLFLLGSGEASLERWIHELSATYPERLASFIGFDEELAHQVYAAADALAIPSRFEPCGLSQMIAMRYGTLPIARATGGLVDTIEHQDTGFLFLHPNPEGLLWAASLAHRYWDSPTWKAMIRRAMARDFSWESAARRYYDRYHAILTAVDERDIPLYR